MQQPRLHYVAAARRQRLQHCGSERRRHCHQVSKIHLGFFGPKSVSGRLVVVERAPRRWKPHKYFFLTFEKNISIYNNDYAAHLKNMWNNQNIVKWRKAGLSLQPFKSYVNINRPKLQSTKLCLSPLPALLEFFLIYCPILIKVRSNFSTRLNVETWSFNWLDLPARRARTRKILHLKFFDPQNTVRA